MQLRVMRPLLVRPWLFHGVTDVLLPLPCLAAYPATLVIPRALLWPLFAFVSVVHFAHDIGSGGSVALHATLALWASVGQQSDAAFAVLAAYLTGVHLPLHTMRETRRHGDWRAARLIGASALGGLVWPARLDCLHVTDSTLRVVIAHVMAEWLAHYFCPAPWSKGDAR